MVIYCTQLLSSNRTITCNVTRPSSIASLPHGRTERANVMLSSLSGGEILEGEVGGGARDAAPGVAGRCVR
eukprot:767921-Hanusia_phi.AAC.3